ncbi:SNF2 family DNA or RNA helicase [Azospirillum agricola]|uniref:SNF2-related protein n=1 Tax=Azospirillum agricola TaxID=1720247 RepID=UPI001AEAF868|nr:DEAD/DEAH box helicase [Azospirillum agricola]MBP2232519.1 SNF2 family DNA or RNA helicase [Azospirillum agricola]
MAGARTYGGLRLVENGRTWELDKIEPHVSIRLKQLFPRIPKGEIPPYRLPHTDILDADLDWFTTRYPLAITDEDYAALTGGRTEFERKQAEMERILLPTYQPPAVLGLREGEIQRLYQAQAVALLQRRGKLLLGDEGGLGKTYSAGQFLCATPDALPAAVVCDPHMQKQWKEKLETHTNLRVCVIKVGTPFITKVVKGERVSVPYELPPADVYVFRISQIAGWAEIFATGLFRSAIYDEPQSLRTGAGTAKGQAAKVLSANVIYRCGLTATPIYNYGTEMWNVMQFIDDTVLGDWDDFRREWCNDLGKIRDPKALGTYLREQHAMLRRLKADVGLELPKVSRIVEHVENDAGELRSIEELAHKLAIRATTGAFTERGQAARDLDMMVRQQTGIAKAKAVAQFVRMLLEADEPVVLWGWHRQVYEIWLRELAEFHPAMYTGSETASAKCKSLDAFLAGETDLLIMSLRSGAGVDGLQHRCSTGVFGELDWSPGIHQQCVWRLDRDGQKNPVTAFFLVTDDGSDPPIMEVLGIKASEAQGVVDPHLGVQQVDTDMSNVRKLVERYLDKKRSSAKEAA